MENMCGTGMEMVCSVLGEGRADGNGEGGTGEEPCPEGGEDEEVLFHDGWRLGKSLGWERLREALPETRDSGNSSFDVWGVFRHDIIDVLTSINFDG